MYQGSCLCGAVKYELTGDIKRITHCHCSMCRKAHGAAFGTYATLPKSEFRFTQGEELVMAFRSSPGVVRTFCQRCGSTLQWYNEISHPELTGITLGTLDTPLEPGHQEHIFAGSKASWYEIKDGLPQSEAGG